eukprot:TRINITY_DN6868_c0_g3_i2.p1 TRINITY_DN6868_c0_g3~~TRINITY_DN6868_c0_g3_i2.p1  ORF type:complete len:206 (+),score=21.44 TRINITY_DN6868_c0_g3_i2:67-684(+)
MGRSRSRGRDRRRDRSRSRDRRGGRGRSRSRSRSRSPPRREARREAPAFRIPPPKREEPDETITLEQRNVSVECNGYLYATIDFTAPGALPETPSPGALVGSRFYHHFEESKGLQYSKLTPGWELTEADDDVKEKVIKPHPWGTHLLVTADNRAYHTSSGGRAGELEQIWDYEKDPALGYRLKKKAGMNSKWHGRLLIRSKVKFS